MRRREFITRLGGTAGAAVLRPQLLAAQPSSLRPLVGVVSPLSMAAAAPYIAALRSSLRALGYVEGRSLTLVLRYGDGVPGHLPPLPSELVGLNPDVIIAGAQSGALADRGVTRTISIVAYTIE